MTMVYIVFLAGYGQVCTSDQINHNFAALRGPSECYWIVPGTEDDT